jgi:hypothetical protein
MADGDIAALRTDFAALRAEFTLIKWMIGGVIALNIAMLARMVLA